MLTGVDGSYIRAPNWHLVWLCNRTVARFAAVAGTGATAARQSLPLPCQSPQTQRIRTALRRSYVVGAGRVWVSFKDLGWCGPVRTSSAGTGTHVTNVTLEDAERRGTIFFLTFRVVQTLS